MKKTRISYFYKFIPIILILTAAALLRFWRIDQLTTFLGDQGFDFLVIKRMVVDGNLTLLGPKIGPYNELGNLYLGPAYYYMLAPSLFIFMFDPLGPAILTASLSVATVGIIYLISRNLLGEIPALLASAIYALNPFIIEQSRAASNPHLIPFFAAVAIYSTFKLTLSHSKSLLWPIVCGFSLGIIFQLHYISISLITAVFIYLIIKKKVKETLITLISFTTAVLPQIIFELKHDFFITNLFLNQLKNGENLLSFTGFKDQVNESLETLSQIALISTNSAVFLVVLFSTAVLFFVSIRKKEEPVLFLLITLVFAVVATSLYPGSIEPHYFSVIYAQTSIIIAFLLTILWKGRYLFTKTTAILLTFILVTTYIANLNLTNSSGYTMPEGWDLNGVKKASKIISDDVASSESFNIAATLDGDTRARPYRYLVEVYGKIPNDVEKYPQSEIIYLISRDEEEVLKRYTVWEIASFRPFDIQKKWDIQNGIKLYRLTKSITQ